MRRASIRRVASVLGSFALPLDPSYTDTVVNQATTMPAPTGSCHAKFLRSCKSMSAYRGGGDGCGRYERVEIEVFGVV